VISINGAIPAKLGTGFASEIFKTGDGAFQASEFSLETQ
jgi:hypothetical protein